MVMRRAGVNRIPLYHVDAFAKEPFGGNPAAVCLLERPYKDGVLRAIAAEMNLSETAFLQKLEQKPIKDLRSFSLRWFTPKTEVDLCGHATLATAAVLFHEVKIPATEVFFETRSGTLTTRLNKGRILLNLPSHETTPYHPSQDFLDAMGISDYISAHFSEKAGDLLILLQNEEGLRNLKPDFERMKSIKTGDRIGGVIVTSEGHGPYDFVSRFFAPWLGINEDPVTGAAHTVLGPYWSKVLGKNEMLAYQASRRGGELTVKVLSHGRVELIGKAVIVSKGELYLQQHEVARLGD
jgi:PhzF family phenazine biosynthesis protein